MRAAKGLWDLATGNSTVAPRRAASDETADEGQTGGKGLGSQSPLFQDAALKMKGETEPCLWGMEGGKKDFFYS